MLVKENSFLKHPNFSCMLCSNWLSSTKWNSQSQHSGGSKDRSQRMLNQECKKDDGEHIQGADFCK